MQPPSGGYKCIFLTVESEFVLEKDRLGFRSIPAGMWRLESKAQFRLYKEVLERGLNPAAE